MDLGSTPGGRGKAGAHVRRAEASRARVWRAWRQPQYSSPSTSRRGNGSGRPAAEGRAVASLAALPTGTFGCLMAVANSEASSLARSSSAFFLSCRGEKESQDSPRCL